MTQGQGQRDDTTKRLGRFCNARLVTCPLCGHVFPLPIMFSGQSLGFRYSKRCPKCHRASRYRVQGGQ